VALVAIQDIRGFLDTVESAAILVLVVTQDRVAIQAIADRVDTPDTVEFLATQESVAIVVYQATREHQDIAVFLDIQAIVVFLDTLALVGTLGFLDTQVILVLDTRAIVASPVTQEFLDIAEYQATAVFLGIRVTQALVIQDIAGQVGIVEHQAIQDSLDIPAIAVFLGTQESVDIQVIVATLD
jgi:hypothetical protein